MAFTIIQYLYLFKSLPTHKNRKLSLLDIIEQVNEADLKAYLIQYAKNDKGFEMVLKAHFVSRVVTGNEDDKYYRILSQIIKPRTLSNPKISVKDKKIINIILEDLTFQMGDLTSTQNFRESYYVIKNCLDKIAYLQHKYEWQSKSIESCRVTFISGLEFLLSSDIAPGLRAEIEGDMFELVLKSYLFPSNPDIWHCLYKFESWNEAQKNKLVKDLLDKHIVQKDNQEIVFLLLLLTYTKDATYKKVLLAIDHQDIFKGLIKLIEEGHFKIANYILSDSVSGYTYNTSVLKCIALHEQGQFGELDDAIKALDAQQQDTNGLDLLLDKLSSTYLSDSVDTLLPWINTLSFRMQCNLYAKANSGQLLLKALDDKNDVEWIRVYDEKLLELNMEAELESLYQKVIIDYLDNHVGEKAIEYMSRVIHRLQSIGQNSMLTRIQSVLYDKYAHRESMSEDNAKQ